MKLDFQAQESSVNHCLIFDPIPFSGGSKTATREALYQCSNKQVKFTILTASKECWADQKFAEKHSIKIIAFNCPKTLQVASTGWLFWLKQLYYMTQIIWLLLRTDKIDIALGASGPGIDMALYLCRFIYKYQLVQLVHGPVAYSRSIGYCLVSADILFYLESSRIDIIQSMTLYYHSRIHLPIGNELARFNLTCPHYMSFENGIGQHNWPTPCEYGQPTAFWAASLLKWKGLDTLVLAGKRLSERIKMNVHVCYIRPKNISLALSKAPANISGFNWHQQPGNLDEIRSRCNIFISTSKNEPFGLSVLEALAAGMCVLIPRDGAYWDRHLTHNLNCIKYKAGSDAALSEALYRLILNPRTISRLGHSALKIANQYRAETCYQKIASYLNQGTLNPNHRAKLNQVSNR